jgi:MFS family permease
VKQNVAGERVTPVRTASLGRPEVRRLPTAFRLWVSGALVSQLGDAAMYFALGWAATAHGGGAAGLVLSAVSIPRVVFLLLGGAVADRVGARTVMIIGDAVMFVVASALVAYAALWGTPLAMLLVAGVVFGTVDAFYLPAAGSMPRRLVEDGQLARAAAVRQTGTQLVTVVGGPLGGLLVGAAGFKAAAATDAVTFAVAFTALVAVRAARGIPQAESRRHVLREAFDGLRVAARTPGLRPLLVIVAGSAGFILPISALLVPLIARQFDWGASSAGLIVGAQGVGAAATAVSVSRYGQAARPGFAACGGLLLAAAGEAVLAAAAGTAIAVCAGLVIGVGTGLFVSHIAPVLLTAAPAEYLSRVQAVFTLVQSVTLVFSNTLIGQLAHLLGPRRAILVCVLATTASAIVGFGNSAVRSIQRL